MLKPPKKLQLHPLPSLMSRLSLNTLKANNIIAGFIWHLQCDLWQTSQDKDRLPKGNPWRAMAMWPANDPLPVFTSSNHVIKRLVPFFNHRANRGHRRPSGSARLFCFSIGCSTLLINFWCLRPSF